MGLSDGAYDVPEALRSLNKQFFANIKDASTSSAKSMAYLLDKSIWTQKFIGDAVGNDIVEYIVGGPTIEQVVRANNKKHPETILELNVNYDGYQIKKSVDGSWSTSLEGALQPADSELIGPMWLASPSGEISSKLMIVTSAGTITTNYYNKGEFFRPVALLKSGVQLEPTESGEYTIKKN